MFLQFLCLIQTEKHVSERVNKYAVMYCNQAIHKHSLQIRCVQNTIMENLHTPATVIHLPSIIDFHSSG